MKIEGFAGNIPPIVPIKTRQILLWICLSIFFFTFVFWFPAGGFIGGILASFPSSFAVYQWGIPSGLIVPVGTLLSGGVVFAILGGVAALPYFGLFLLMGSLIGLNGRINRSLDYSVFMPVAIVFISGATMFWLQVRNVEEGSLWDTLARRVAQTVVLIAKEHGNGNVKITPYVEEQIGQAVHFMVRLLPGISFASLLLTGAINALATRRYAEKQGFSLPKWQETAKWRSSDWLVWFLIGAGFLTLVPASRILGLNILIALGTIYLFQGLSIMLFFLSQWRLPLWSRILLTVFAITQQYLAIALALLGLFDVWFDIRRIETKTKDIKE
ncbi:MAG: DUF2232 domain-containing protein [Thermodesulforhabdaceae bacterium]